MDFVFVFVLHNIVEVMSLITIDEDPWLVEFAALQRLTQEINLQITERDAKNSSSGKFHKIIRKITKVSIFSKTI